MELDAHDRSSWQCSHERHDVLSSSFDVGFFRLVRFRQEYPSTGVDERASNTDFVGVFAVFDTLDGGCQFVPFVFGVKHHVHFSL